MVEGLLSLLGPLAYPECRRVGRRSLLIWLRMIPPVLAALILGLTLMMGQITALFDPSHQLDNDLEVVLGVVIGGGLTLILLMVPALLAGSLAGEKERGSIALLLSTEASSWDIVVARWIGRLAALGLVVGALVPFVVTLLALRSAPLLVCLTIGALVLALGLGGGGVALAVSALSRRGRDALLLIYLLDIIALIASSYVQRFGTLDWLALALNPLLALGPLLKQGLVAPALGVAAGWMVVGTLGLMVAAWRLRPSCLNDRTHRLGQARRRAWRRVPAVGERPMLWKELYIDRAGSLGRVGRWLGGLMTLWLGLGSLILGLYAVLGEPGTPSDPQWAIDTLGGMYGGTVVAISLLIQWSIGLRSAVMVASERERGTWDGLLTSPLTPSEIVAGKLGGSWFALRWLVVAALLAWTVTALLGGMTLYRFSLTLAETAQWGLLMAAFGLAMSLRTATATRAMAATVGGWCLFFAAAKSVATLGTLLVLVLIAYLFEGLTGPRWFLSWFQVGNDWGSVLVAALITGLVLLDVGARFDRIAGRAAGGAAASAIDQMIHGRPMAPVRLYPVAASATAPAPDVAAVGPTPAER